MLVICFLPLEHYRPILCILLTLVGAREEENIRRLGPMEEERELRLLIWILLCLDDFSSSYCIGLLINSSNCYTSCSVVHGFEALCRLLAAAYLL
jgi:hypothetical protein